MTTILFLVLLADIFYITWKKDQQVREAYNAGFKSAVDQINRRNAA